jgi:hypothetical protein
MTSRTTGFTPFKLLYGEEAMLPEEIKHQSLWVTQQTPESEEAYSKENIEGNRLEAIENITQYQEQTKRWRDKKVA